MSVISASITSLLLLSKSFFQSRFARFYYYYYHYSISSQFRSFEFDRPFRSDATSWNERKTSLSAFTRTGLQIILPFHIFLYFRWTRSSPLSASSLSRRHETRFHHRVPALNRFSTLLLSELFASCKIRSRFLRICLKRSAFVSFFFDDSFLLPSEHVLSKNSFEHDFVQWFSDLASLMWSPFKKTNFGYVNIVNDIKIIM